MKLSKAQKQGFTDLEDKKWEESIFQFLSLMDAWKNAHQFDLSKNPYLAKTISDVIYLNEFGKRTYEVDNAAPVKAPHRVIVQVQHIEIEHIQSKSKSTQEAFVASNLQLSVADAKDGKELLLACNEKAKAAISLVMLAKSSGWEDVDIGGDPYEQYALALLCDENGIEHNIDIHSLSFDTPTMFKGKNNSDTLVKASIENSLSIIMNQRPDMSFDITPPYYEVEKQNLNADVLDDVFGDSAPLNEIEDNDLHDTFETNDSFSLGAISKSSPNP